MQSVPSFILRKPLRSQERATVWNMTDGWCWYCGDKLNPFSNFVVEHVVPLSRGGEHRVSNMVPSCAECNRSKRTMLIEEWRASGQCEILNDEGKFWFERNDNHNRMHFAEKRGEHDPERWRSVMIQGFETYHEAIW
jgi:hypothetical protein